MPLRFEKKPILHLTKSGRPRGELYKDGKHRVVITRRMARTNEEASKSCILHELREILLSHHLPCALGGTTHLLAVQYETTRDVVISENYYTRRRPNNQWMGKLPSLFSAST